MVKVLLALPSRHVHTVAFLDYLHSRAVLLGGKVISSVPVKTNPLVSRITHGCNSFLHKLGEPPAPHSDVQTSQKNQTQPGQTGSVLASKWMLELKLLAPKEHSLSKDFMWMIRFAEEPTKTYMVIKNECLEISRLV